MDWKAKYSWLKLISIVLTALLFLEVTLLFATDYAAIVSDQPAYEVSLIVVGSISLMVFFGLLLLPNRPRSWPSARGAQASKKPSGF